jgi:hypothetical protein
MFACTEVLAPWRYRFVRKMRKLRICGTSSGCGAGLDAGLQAAQEKIVGI